LAGDPGLSDCPAETSTAELFRKTIGQRDGPRHLGERRSDPFSSGVSQITSHRLPAVIDRWRHVDIDRTRLITGLVR